MSCIRYSVGKNDLEFLEIDIIRLRYNLQKMKITVEGYDIASVLCPIPFHVR